MTPATRTPKRKISWPTADPNAHTGYYPDRLRLPATPDTLHSRASTTGRRSSSRAAKPGVVGALSHGDTLAPEPSVRLSARVGRRLAGSLSLPLSPPARIMLADAVALSFFDAADRLVATKDDVALRRGLRVPDSAGAECRRGKPAHERAARDGRGWQRDEEEACRAQHADNAPPTTPSSTTTTPTALPSKRHVVLGVTVDLGRCSPLASSAGRTS
ncbi:hypothetical protein C8R46DRAFT_1208269 [Mycena filopes]|nr:hypothetical protein C8R46DRAFT_1208269 [Mycena filopes]